MAFVPGYEHDLFVSYAHVDDAPVLGAERGWVSTLVTTLQGLLAQQLGRAESLELWLDHQLSKHALITPEIIGALQKTAIFLVILSPGYLASEWCQREKDIFWELVRDRKRSGFRVFVVHRDMVEPDKLPSQFKDLAGYKFWEEDKLQKKPRILGWPTPVPSNPKDQRYYDELDALSRDLAKELRRLAANDQRIEQASTSGTVVFLAEVTDDLEDEREEVRRYLDQAGIQVLPDGVVYPRDGSAFQEEVDSDLHRSAFFIQLLSSVAGKRPPGFIHSYVRIQHERAKAAGKPIIQWRRRGLDVGLTRDADHRALLDAETVMAVGLEEFKSEIVKRTIPKQELECNCPLNNACVFVDAETSDKALSDSLCELLRGNGIDIALPPQAGTRMRDLLKQHALNCDAAIFVYGNAPNVWVTSQLYEWRKLATGRERPPKFLAVYEGPPPECKEPLSLKWSGLRTINCRNGIDQAAVHALVRELRSEVLI